MTAPSPLIYLARHADPPGAPMARLPRRRHLRRRPADSTGDVALRVAPIASTPCAA
jgi:hypothetical protein